MDYKTGVAGLRQGELITVDQTVIPCFHSRPRGTKLSTPRQGRQVSVKHVGGHVTAEDDT